MATKATKQSKETEKSEQTDVITPEQQAMSFLKANKGDHYNFEETISYKVRASSLMLTAAMDGGIEPGAHRACGTTTGGKTSCTLDLMYQFLQGPTLRRGVYVKSEGRLSEEVKARSGITFTTDVTQWTDKTCFVLESSTYEAVFGFMGDLIRNNSTGTRYFFIVDSMDMMGKRADLEKGLEEAGQVAGGALITSVFFKKSSVALAKRGHIMWFISQVRDSIKINPYEKSAPRQGSASGGHALEHAGDWVLEFLPRFGDDIIRENPGEKSSKPIGHYCRVKIVKSNNEKYGVEVRYPIKYGRKGATSVWVEREIVDLLLMWELVEKSGAWLRPAVELRAEVKEATGEELLPEKIQGMDNLYKLLEDTPKLKDYLFEKFTKLITGK